MLIDLSNFGKADLPAELFNYPHTTRLILRGHGLRGISPDIGQIKHLIQLDLCSYNSDTRDWHTFLDKIPVSICSLKHLVQLDLCFNGISSLPFNLHHLRSLRYLNLGCNQLADVPVTIFMLENLQFLNLRFNKLSFLHPNVGRLKALAHLDVAENMIAEMPDSIGDCKMLSVLLLDSLFITELPQSVAQLHSLTLLDLSNNSRLQTVPAGLDKLKHLSALHAYNCHSSLLRSRELLRLQRVLVKNKLSDLAFTQCTKRMPLQHNFDMIVERKLEVVNQSENSDR